MNSYEMQTTHRPYPRAVAEEVELRRPDLDVGDIAAVLTSDHSLSAAEVIEILDEAASDWEAEVAYEATLR